MFTLLFLASSALAVTVAQDASSVPPMLALNYKYGGYPKISTDIHWGTPEQKAPIETVVDLGSADFWVFGPNATINSGSNYLGVPGPCNETVKPYFRWPKSRTATKPVDGTRAYFYGGNGKIVSSYYTVNDTIRFSNTNYASFRNQRVAVANFTILKQLATTCDGAPYERSILGLSPYTKSGTGPSFRQDLLDNDKIKSSTLSMWFDKGPDTANGTFKGTALFGAVPKSKFTGDLVRVAPRPPAPPYVGYYVGTPIFRTAPLGKPKSKQVVKQNKDAPKQCLIDSGFGQDTLPIAKKDFLSITGLIISGGYPAFNGTCDSIPHSASLDFIFSGLNKKNVTVKVPLRNYARGNTDYLNKHNLCGLSMELDSGSTCYIGAPFFTAAFLAFNDEKNEIAIAQGGVSRGAAKGQGGLGEFSVVKKGQSLPYTSN